MNFGEILNAWEEERGENGQPKSDEPMDRWLDQYPPDPSLKLPGLDRSDSEGLPESRMERATFMQLRHEAELDLHGLTVPEAMARIDSFLVECHTRGMRKVLIIHGKGNHNETGESVLARNTRVHLANHDLAGRVENPPRRYGGRGALWVRVR